MSPKPRLGPGVVAVLNPNTSRATTAALEALLAEELTARPDLRVRGYTANNGAAMITDLPALEASVPEVLAMATAAANDPGHRLAAVVVGAFGDPGLTQLRTLLSGPVVGLAEAGIRAAAVGGRRFGIATTTPQLQSAMQGRVEIAGVGDQFTGFRFTDDDDVLGLVNDPVRLADGLGRAARRCFESDGAECVLIGGGPLSRAAQTLAAGIERPIVIPLVEAARELVQRVPFETNLSCGRS